MSFPETTPYPESSQASTALVISIVGLVCCQVLGIVAWVMAHNELEAIKAGKRSPANEGTASAARIIGIIGTVLFGLGVLALIFFAISMAFVPWSEFPFDENFWREDMFR